MDKLCDCRVDRDGLDTEHKDDALCTVKSRYIDVQGTAS